APEARLDPALFVPELVALHQDARAEVAAERTRQQALTQPERAKTPSGDQGTLGGPRLVPVAPAASPPPAHLSLIPFGVGQFANGEGGKGTAFLVGELAL